MRPAGVPSRRIPDILSIAASGLLPSRRIQDFLSIAATGLLPSRRIPDFLSINEGRDKSRADLFRVSLIHIGLIPGILNVKRPVSFANPDLRAGGEVAREYFFGNGRGQLVLDGAF